MNSPGNTAEILQEYYEEDEEHLGFLSLGTSSGVWPHYLRLMFISGYRYVQSLNPASLPCAKQTILDVILECCPSHRHKVKNKFEGSCNNAYHSLFMSIFGGASGLMQRLSFGGGFGRGTLLGALDPEYARGMFEAHKYYSEASVLTGTNRMYLGAVGLDPIVELALVRQADIPSVMVRRAAAMLQTLKPFVPQTVADLAETPYDAADEDSLDNNECVQLVNEFIPLFEKAAGFGDCIAEQS